MDPKMNYASHPAEAKPEATTGNFLGHLTGVFFSPSEAFPKIIRESSVLTALVLPMLLMAVVMGISAVLPLHRIGTEEMARRQFEPLVEAGWMPREAANQQIAQAADPARATRTKVMQGVWTGVTMIVVLLIVAGVFKLFAMMMGREAAFRPLLSVISYAYLAISLIQLPVFAASLYLKNPDEINIYNPVMSNLGALVGLIAPGMNKFVTGLASWIDLFGIWRIILLAIGCAAVATKMKSGTAAIPHIILYAIIAVLFSAFAGLMG